MNRLLASLTVSLLILAVAGVAAAQQTRTPGASGSSAAQPSGGGEGTRPPVGSPGAPGQGPGMMDDLDGCGMMGPGMMGGMMGPGMMGGGMGPMMMAHMGRGAGPLGGHMAHWAQLDPKTRGLMMQMRGEMLRAVGDVLIKYGKLVEAQPK